VTPNLEKVVVAGTHYGVLDEPPVVEVAAALSARLRPEPSYESPGHATIVFRDDADSAPSMSHQRVGRRV
jgi:hypothetical protein